MKRKRKGLILIPLVVCAGLTAAYTMLYVRGKDSTAPVLKLNSELLEVSVNATEAELLKGVSAWDDVDGNVSDLIVVEKISSIRKDHTADVTYVAFDTAGNVSRISKEVRYVDYVEPHFTLKRSLVFTTSNVPDVVSYIGATDVLDGDLSSKVKGNMVSDLSSLAVAGEHQVEFRVTNSMGDTVHLTLPVDVFEPDAYNATLTLTEQLVYVQKDSEFDAESYLSSIKIGAVETMLDGSESGVRVYVNDYTDPARFIGSGAQIVNVEMVNGVDIQTAGVYSVTYVVSVVRGTTQYNAFGRLHVVVEE